MTRGLLGLALLTVSLWAQQPALPGSGQVLFSSENGAPARAAPTADPIPEVTVADRTAPTMTLYDLDVHLVPAHAAITVRSRLEVRNDGAAPLHLLPLQLSWSLRWESVALRTSTGTKLLRFVQHRVQTDADHTGAASEALIVLDEPLAPGSVLSLSAFYSGEIPVSAERLERIGAPPADAASADWDSITPELTALRGFGNVLWYPVAAEPVFLGDGAKLFQSVARARLRQQTASVHLRLSVEYTGDAPDAAFFCGQRQPLVAIYENRDIPVSDSPGVATADFAAQPLGFRSPSLFITDRAPTVTDDTLIAAVTDHYDVVPQYAATATLVKPLLTEWLGPAPATQLSLIDHRGQPFADGALAVLPLRASAPAALAPSLVHLLTPAWFRSERPWLQEGVPQLLSLLWRQRTEGREAAIAELTRAARTLALAEPAGCSAGQVLAPLIASVPGASDEVYLRSKSAAILWMLRTLAGDEALRQTLIAYRDDRKADADPRGFEGMLDRIAKKDLRWFFEDWVYRDCGLPDLTIVGVTPRELPPVGGKSAGWLVSVEVRNEGDAVAEVPVTVRSGTLTTTVPLRISGHSSASTRILFETQPEAVQVNDGSVPELRTSSHMLQLRAKSP